MKALLLSCFLLVAFPALSCADNHADDSAGTQAGQCTPEEHTSLQGAGFAQAEIKQLCGTFRPGGYSILNATKGNLNRDGLDDIVLVLKKDGERENTEEESKRPLYLLIGQGDGSYKLAAQNDNAVYCVHCGGMMGDPFMGITIKNGYFSVEHYGGSSWRWSKIITFKYAPAEKQWFLHKDGGEYFHAGDPKTMKTEVKTVQDFGVIPFAAYNIYTAD